MPDQDDIANQQTLLEMHRQTLDVLLKQQAQFGEAYAPPAIVNGIRSARDSIAQIKQSLRDQHNGSISTASAHRRAEQDRRARDAERQHDQPSGRLAR